MDYRSWFCVRSVSSGGGESQEYVHFLFLCCLFYANFSTPYTVARHPMVPLYNSDESYTQLILR